MKTYYNSLQFRVMTTINEPAFTPEERLTTLQAQIGSVYFTALKESRSAERSKPHEEENDFYNGALTALKYGYSVKDLNLFTPDARQNDLQNEIKANPVGIREGLYSILSYAAEDETKPKILSFFAETVYQICPTAQRAKRMENRLHDYKAAELKYSISQNSPQ